MRFVLWSLLVSAAVMAADLQTIPLQPAGSSAFNPGPEHDATTLKDNLVAGKPVIRLANVSDPTLTFYPAPRRTNTGTTVIVFPGGGYNILALDLEGSEICEWLNSIGVNAALVKYRVPAAPGALRYSAPFSDAQNALAVVRSHAGEWHINARRIGVIGCSAGGHLAALLSNADPRPDFALLVYPAYLTAETDLTVLAQEFVVSAQTPPTFLVQTEDDSVHVENSLVYYGALKKCKVAAEMHLFATGGHGYGLRQTAEPVTQWPKLAEGWLRARGLLTAASR
jgi:acetyl esterase/lipase